jgi:hypothetical protein
MKKMLADKESAENVGATVVNVDEAEEVGGPEVDQEDSLLESALDNIGGKDREQAETERQRLLNEGEYVPPPRA